MRTHPHRLSARRICAGLAAGTVGGLAGAWAMGRFQALVQRAEQRLAGERRADGSSEREPAPELEASPVARAVGGRALTQEEQREERAGVHYGLATAVGALYGALSEIAPGLTAWAGMPFGAGLWLSSNRILVPAKAITPPPAAVLEREHGSAFAAHVVYAVTAETLRRALRGAPR
ncbi:MAG TPA: DUF1440 domain-containing protein [Planctomycetota bacterium]|nr:DUF1440 domain-containing protein [Planctomycetota bacterium]